MLVITNKGVVSGQGMLHVFSVGPDGLPSTVPTTTVTAGLAPFAFTFDRRGHLLVTDAAAEFSSDGVPIGDVTTYAIANDGSLEVIDQELTLQSASCWIVGTWRGFYYVTNTLSGTITGYHVASDGSLARLNEDGVTAVTGDENSQPTDMALSKDGRFLYTVIPGTGTLGIYRVNRDGSLTPVDPVEGLPVVSGMAGLVAR
jgi:6-phosphogluconolactonase